MLKREVVLAPYGGPSHGNRMVQDLKYRLLFHDVWMEYLPKDPPARIAIQVADANAQPGRNAHFALDVIAIDPGA